MRERRLVCADFFTENHAGIRTAADAGVPTLKPDWDTLLRDLDEATAALQKVFIR
jgi:hypothetical protein